MTLEEERKVLDEQRRTLERERREFTRWVEIEDRRLEQQQKLFDMKFKILEEELVKLTSEKEHVQRSRFIIRIIWTAIRIRFRKLTVSIISCVHNMKIKKTAMQFVWLSFVIDRTFGYFCRSACRRLKISSSDMRLESLSFPCIL